MSPNKLKELICDCEKFLKFEKDIQNQVDLNVKRIEKIEDERKFEN